MGIHVLGIAGSLRAGSFNRQLLAAAVELAPAGMQISHFERLGDIPPFNQDVEAKGDPEPVTVFKRAIAEVDALLIATPEYNYGVPGVLKNALDWASRPPGKSVLQRKPVALMGASPGPHGTARAQLQLRQMFVFTETHVLPKPEIYVAKAHERIDASGRVTDEVSRRMIGELLQALVAWVTRLRG